MLLCFPIWTLEQISAIISIGTPVILLLWFYYSQRQHFSDKYYEKIPGIYAGFTNPTSDHTKEDRIYSGIIMNIRDIDNKGYFIGEFDYAETPTKLIGNNSKGSKLIDGVASFYGKLDFELNWNKTRHPFKHEENRVYSGKFYIVDRLDFDFENYKIETYLKAEYDILHYREMKTLKFTLSKIYKNKKLSFPSSFTLSKTLGLNFEPYRNLIDTVFLNDTRVDK